MRDEPGNDEEHSEGQEKHVAQEMPNGGEALTSYHDTPVDKADSWT